MRILQGHRGPVRCLAYSPDGRYLASSAEDNTVRMWQLETGHQGLQLHTSGGYARWIAFEENGNALIAANTISGPRQGWSLSYLAEGVLSCQPLTETESTFVAHKSLTRSIFSTAGRKVQRLFPQRSGLLATRAFSADDRLLAVTGPPCTVRLIDALSGRELAAYDWDIGPIYAVAFSPDGMTAAAGGRDFRIVVWDLEI